MSITYEKVDGKVLRYTKPIAPKIENVTLDQLRFKLAQLQGEKSAKTNHKQNFILVIQEEIDKLNLEIDEVKAMILECKTLGIVSEMDEKIGLIS